MKAKTKTYRRRCKVRLNLACVQCGKPFTAQLSAVNGTVKRRGKPPMYCSHHCFCANRKANPHLVKLTCNYCNREFTLPYYRYNEYIRKYNRPPKYCGIQCAIKACKMLYTKVPPEQIHELHEAHPELSYAEIARRVGLTRERVRQVLGNANRPCRCSVCNIPITEYRKTHRSAYEQKLCPAHHKEWKEKARQKHWVKVTCLHCGKEFEYSVSKYRYQVKNNKPLPIACCLSHRAKAIREKYIANKVCAEQSS